MKIFAQVLNHKVCYHVSMTVKEQVLTRIEILPQQQSQSLLDYVNFLYFQAQTEMQTRKQTQVEPYDELNQLLEACTVSTGISDLAAQHDHYLYGKEKHAA